MARNGQAPRQLGQIPLISTVCTRDVKPSVSALRSIARSMPALFSSAGVTGSCAADERVERRQSIHEAVGEQELERAVDRGRRRRMSFPGEHFEDLVRPERPVALPDDLEHPLSHGSELRSTFATERPSLLERVRHAVTMIVFVGEEPTTLNIAHEIESRKRPSPSAGRENTRLHRERRGGYFTMHAMYALRDSESWRC